MKKEVKNINEQAIDIEIASLNKKTALNCITT
jgi:hypothetical protein